MPWDFSKELARKFVHLFAALYLIIYIIVGKTFSHSIALLVLSFLLVVLIEIEYIRLEWKYKIPLIMHFWKLKRPEEKDRLGAEVFFLIGVIISLAVFDFRIAAAAILMTTFGDLAAALVGKKFGRWRVKRKGKSIEGAIAELVVNLIVGFFVVRQLSVSAALLFGFYHPLGQPIWPVIVTMALTATIVETAITKIDDNLLVPLFSGFAGQVVLMIIGSGVI